MVHHCCALNCSERSGKGQPKTVSFHNFPKDESKRSIWGAMLRRSNFVPTDYTKICSRHFTEDCFDRKKLGGRWLKPTAVPTLFDFEIPSTSRFRGPPTKKMGVEEIVVAIAVDTRNETMENSLISAVEVSNDSDVIEIDSKSVTQPLMRSLGASTSFVEPEIGPNEWQNSNSLSKSPTPSAEVVCSATPNKSTPHLGSGEAASEAASWSTPLRRPLKCSTKRRFKYIGDFCSPTALRSPSKAKKFISLVKREMALKDASLKRMKQKIRRLNERVTSLKTICNELKKNGLISDHASDLLVATCSAPEFLRRGLSKTRPHKYSPELRSFALTLHFYSPKAYNYVRENFTSSLPHESTLRKWYGAVDCSAGINWGVEPLLIALAEEATSAGKAVVAGLCIDEMAIRQHVQWDGSRLRGVVDLGTGLDVNDQTPHAKDALVVMLTAVNGAWKLPVAYYLVNGLTGYEKSVIVKSVLEFISKCGIVVITLTFDGALSNLRMAEELGASFSLNHLSPWFMACEQEIGTIWDNSHMAKLVRNAFASYEIRNKSNEIISWSYITWLHAIQEENDLHLANKLTVRHVNWYREKMKVKLAVQTMSKSVADALDYLRVDLKHETFSMSKATSEFIRVFNNLFDIFNSRNKFAKGFNKPISKENAGEIFTFFEFAKEYITGLSLNSKNILLCKRKTGFFINMEVVKNIYFKFINIESPKLNFLITYKLSQDHLELFFGAIRSKGGFNNNPTAVQFEAAYKRLLTHRKLIAVKGSNCVPLDDTDILCVSSNFIQNDAFLDKINFNAMLQGDEAEERQLKIDHDHSYFSPNIQFLNEFVADVVGYIAGFVEKQIKKKLKCEGCLDAIDKEERDNNSFVMLKNRGGASNTLKERSVSLQGS